MEGSSKKDKAADANGLLQEVGFRGAYWPPFKRPWWMAFCLPDRSSLLNTMLAP